MAMNYLSIRIYILYKTSVLIISVKSNIVYLHSFIIFLEFNKLITNSQLNQIPILVLGNKIDLPQACSEEELKDILGIEDYESNLKLFMCSIINKYNIGNAFQWLSSKI